MHFKVLSTHVHLARYYLLPCLFESRLWLGGVWKFSSRPNSYFGERNGRKESWLKMSMEIFSWNMKKSNKVTCAPDLCVLPWQASPEIMMWKIPLTRGELLWGSWNFGVLHHSGIFFRNFKVTSQFSTPESLNSTSLPSYWSHLRINKKKLLMFRRQRLFPQK